MAKSDHLPKATPPKPFPWSELSAARSLFDQPRAVWALLGVLVILSFGLRFFQLSQPSLWMDEIVIYREAFAGQYQSVSYSAHASHLAPVSFLMQTFGQTPFWLRAWGCFLGAMAPAVLFLVLLLGGGVRLALAGGVLAALSPYLVYYSQDGNYYGGMTFYTCVQMLCVVLFFRGLPVLSLLGLMVVSFISLRNHPFGIVPGALCGLVMVGGALVLPGARRDMVAFHPGGWRRRPLVPIALGAAAASVYLVPRGFTAMSRLLGRMFDSEAGHLNNVSFTFAFFRDHLAAFGVSYSRFDNLERSLWWIPALLAVVGLAGGIHQAIRRRDERRMALLALCVLVPVVAFTLLFTIREERNYYLRYLTFLVPALIALKAFAACSIAGMVERRCPGRAGWFAFAGVLAIPALVYLGFTVRYHSIDFSNYETGLEFLSGEFSEGDRLITPTRNDLLSATFFLQRQDLPRTSPALSWTRQARFPDIYAGAFPVMMNGEEASWIVSAEGGSHLPDLTYSTEDDLWIYAAWGGALAPRYAGFIHHAMPPVYHGFSNQSKLLDLKIHRWDYGHRVVYPDFAARFRAEELAGRNLLLAEAGTWSVELEDGTPLETLNAERPSPIEADGFLPADVDPGMEVRFRPVLPDRVVYPVHRSANWPEHNRYDERGEGPIGPAIWSEFEAPFDFLVHQPDGGERHLVVHFQRRDESDPVLESNNAAIPPGFFYFVAINGVHHGIWQVPSGEPEWISHEIELPLEPGNHRITVGGFFPRLTYTPRLPLVFGGVEWVAGSANDPSPSLESQGRLSLSSGWTSPVPTSRGGEVARGWERLAGNHSFTVDPDRRGPLGDEALRIDYPRDDETPSAVISPPMPVTEGTLAVSWLYLSFSGLEHHEITPFTLFADSQGQVIGGQNFHNGSNLRGDTYGKGWLRRQIIVPVPSGASMMSVGIQTFFIPRRHGTDGGTVWVASPGSVGMEGVAFGDPNLSQWHYYGGGE